MKEYLYVGYYIDTQGRYILKIGTTNDLKRRQAEHNRNYKRANPEDFECPLCSVSKDNFSEE